MVVYGLLTYDQASGQVSIPNRELMMKFNDLLISAESLGYVHRLARESARMLKATIAGDTETMAEIFEYAHNPYSPATAKPNCLLWSIWSTWRQGTNTG